MLVAPILAGPANHAGAGCATFPDIRLLGHPSFGGASRIAPDLLFGTLFACSGADAVIFSTHGGRFGYAPETCRAHRRRPRAPSPRLDMRRALPTPAGGMTLARVPEILDFYGPDTMF